MTKVLSVDQVSEQLAAQFVEIPVAEPALGAVANVAAQAVVSQVTGGILAIVSRYLADNADLLPPKEAVLEAVNKAIDAMLARMNRPLLTSLISRTVKNLIADVVDSLYEAILNPPAADVTTTTPLVTEV